MTVSRAVCSPNVRAEAPKNSEKKQIAGGRASFKSLSRDLPYGLIISAAATLTVFGVLIALLDGWAS